MTNPNDSLWISKTDSVDVILETINANLDDVVRLIDNQEYKKAKSVIFYIKHGVEKTVKPSITKK